jgi:hypothetical protein
LAATTGTRDAALIWIKSRARATASNGGEHHRSLMENTMTPNVGGIDRSLRILVGLVLIALAATGTVGWWGWLGALPLLTGLMGWCPPYAMFGISTCKTKG